MLSLRQRVLLVVAAINVAIFGVGLGFLAHDREVQIKRSTDEAEKLLVYTLSRTIDIQGEISVSAILRWPKWYDVADAIIMRANVDRAPNGDIVPRGAYLNPVGRARRRADFPEQEILRQIAAAVAAGREVSGAQGLAVPILDPRGGLWGGCWIALPPGEGAFELATRLLPWFLLSTLLLTLGTFFALRRFVLDPVRELAAAARRVADGDLTARASDPGRGDEISGLIASFNAMTMKVEGYNAQLARDVEAATEHVRRAEAAAMTQRRLAATGELAAGIAHEINNPLGGLINAVETLEHGQLPSERRTQYFALLKHGLERIQSTVGQLLRFTPRSSKPVPTSLAQPVSDAIALVSHRAHDLGVEIRLFPADAPELTGDAARARLASLPPVLGQANELGQAVLNLLVNALDALEAGAKQRGRIDVSIGVDGDALRLVVADNGPGVPAAELPRVADLFYTTKEVGKGTGLGLAIVHNVVHGHGGSMQLSAAAGGGFRVEIHLPIRPELRRRASPHEREADA